MDVRWVNVTLDDVQDGDVAGRLARAGRNHAVLGLQQSAHHVEHCRTSDGLGLYWM